MISIKKPILLLSIIIIIFGTLGGFIGKAVFSGDDVTSFNIGSKNLNVDPIFKHKMEAIYPGGETSKNLRIYNDLDVDMMIKNLDMGIKLRRDSVKLDFEDEDAKDYMRHMNLKISYLNPLTNLSEGHIFEGSFNDFLLGKKTNILIPKNKNIELVYRVSMDKEALINIQNIEGVIDFGFKIDEVIDSDKDDNNDKDQETWYDGGIYYGGTKLTDLKETWSHDCIKTLLSKGIIKPYKDGTIKAKQFITRGETAVLVGRGLGLEGGSNIINPYKDDIGKWALGYVEDGLYHKIIQGYPDNSFRPRSNISREEAFTIICKLLNLHGDHERNREEVIF